MKKVLLLFCVLSVAFADVYMHNPRGSNDRLNEKNQNRQNANRIFDSQNNAAGGYAWGPSMSFYVGSRLEIQWTAQHSCGIGNNHCDFILQYMCDEQAGEKMRDGTTTDRVPDVAGTGADTQGDTSYGRQETYGYYQNCKARSRNKGLFVADQNLGNSATSTRQNAGGDRHGFECTEERDYYPYWHPSPWIDIAILTSNTSRCKYFQTNSQNVLGKGYCTSQQHNNPSACAGAQGGQAGKWQVQDSWKTKNSAIAEPSCVPAPRMRDNHLGSADNTEGQMASYMWILPNTVSENCVLRLRYNISTYEYDGWNTFADKNAGASPIKNNPTHAIGVGCGAPEQVCNLTLALNTNQYGRTFQDRSYMFKIIARPKNMTDADVIHNLNVRGKRGNIVQTYPAVEYDFVPNHLRPKLNEYIHFQWTGSDFNANNGGNNAEGTDGTDRCNIVEILNPAYNRPRGLDTNNSWSFFTYTATAQRFAHVDQWNGKTCLTYAELLAKFPNDANARETDPGNCAKLNAAANYFNGGLVRVEKSGEFYYMSTRNNNFSNRSQKGTITVAAALPNWALGLIGVGGGIAVLGAAALVAAKKGMLPFFGGH